MDVLSELYDTKLVQEEAPLPKFQMNYLGMIARMKMEVIQPSFPQQNIESTKIGELCHNRETSG